MADNEGFLGGLSSGLQQGVNMGYLALQAQAMRQNQERQAQLMQAEQQKMEWEKKNAMLERGVSVFKELPKRLRPSFYSNNLAPLFKQVYGMDLGKMNYNDNVEKGIEDFNSLIKLKREGKITNNEFLTQAAEIRSMVSREESDQIGSILGDLPGGKPGNKGFSVDALLSPQETALFYKIQLGMKDEDIQKAIRAGLYPKQIRQGAAAMLKKGGTDWGAIGQMLANGASTSDSVKF